LIEALRVFITMIYVLKNPLDIHIHLSIPSHTRHLVQAHGIAANLLHPATGKGLALGADTEADSPFTKRTIPAHSRQFSSIVTK